MSRSLGILQTQQKQLGQIGQVDLASDANFGYAIFQVVLRLLRTFIIPLSTSVIFFNLNKLQGYKTPIMDIF